MSEEVPSMETPSAENEALRQALDQVRRFATLNFVGGGFDPEHMRAIANYCTGVLNGERPLPEDLSDAPDAFFLELLRENGWTVTRVDDVTPPARLAGTGTPYREPADRG